MYISPLLRKKNSSENFDIFSKLLGWKLQMKCKINDQF